MSDKTRFLKADLGATIEVPVQVDAVRFPEAARTYRYDQYVKLVDGREITARSWTGTGIELGFRDGRGARAVRRYLSETAEPNVSIVRLRLSDNTGNASRYEGTLTLTRPCRVVLLEAPLVIEIDPAGLSAWTGAPTESIAAELPGRLVLTLPGESSGLAVVQVNMLFRTEDMRGEVIRVLTDDNFIFHCRPKAGRQQRLVVESVEAVQTFGSRKGGPGPAVLFGGSLLRLVQGVSLVPPSDTSSFMDPSQLALLYPPQNKILDAWLRYHQLEQEFKKAVIEELSKDPLKYSGLEQRGNGWSTRIHTAAETLRRWCKDKPTAAGEIPFRTPVVLRAESEEVKAELVSLQKVDLQLGTAVARLALTDAKPVAIPVTATIFPTDDPGTARQNERRAQAAKMFLRGDGPNLHLGTWLLDPSQADAPEKRSLSADSASQRPLNAIQKEAVEKALGTRDILLIQGPPGTGKTQVIVEILHRLKKACLKEKRPLRVIVSSTQNDAVENVVSKLGSALVIHHVVKDSGTARQEMYAAETRKVVSELERLNQSCSDYSLAQQTLLEQRDAVLAGLEHSLLGCGSPREQAALLRTFFASEAASWLPVVFRQEGERLLTELESAPPAALEEVGKNGSQGTLPSRLLALLQAPFSEQAACELAVLVEQGELSDSGHPARALVEDLGHNISQYLERKRPLDRLARKWDDLRASLSMEREAPPSAPIRQTNPLEWSFRLREHLSRQMEELPLSPSLVRQRLAANILRSPHAWENIKKTYSEVVAATLQRCADFEVPVDEDPFDMAIIDEAGRSSPFDLLIPMVKARRTILIGDQQQLPPTVEELLRKRLESEQNEVPDLSEESLFSVLYHELRPENKILLTEQYRMHEAIGDLVSEQFYDNKLNSYWSGERSAGRLSRLGLFKDRPLVWIDTSASLADKERTQRNEVELEVIDRILAHLAEQKAAGVTLGPKHVGIITFYREQKDEIAAKIGCYPSLVDHLEWGTVDAFQGKEFPVVILSTVRHNRKGFIGFLSLPHRINVAFSRAQSQLIILGSSQTFCSDNEKRGSRYLAGAYQACSREQGLVLTSDEVTNGNWGAT